MCPLAVPGARSLKSMTLLLKQCVSSVHTQPPGESQLLMAVSDVGPGSQYSTCFLGHPALLTSLISVPCGHGDWYSAPMQEIQQNLRLPPSHLQSLFPVKSAPLVPGISAKWSSRQLVLRLKLNGLQGPVCYRLDSEGGTIGNLGDGSWWKSCSSLWMCPWRRLWGVRLQNPPFPPLCILAMRQELLSHTPYYAASPQTQMDQVQGILE